MIEEASYFICKAVGGEGKIHKGGERRTPCVPTLYTASPISLSLFKEVCSYICSTFQTLMNARQRMEDANTNVETQKDLSSVLVGKATQLIRMEKLAKVY